MRTGNPAMNPEIFERSMKWDAIEGAAPKTATVSGTVNAALILIGLAAASGIATWTLLAADRALALPILLPGLAVGLIVGLVLAFSPKWSPYLAPIGAIAEGAFAGGVSVFITERYLKAVDVALVGQALGVTAGVFVAMLLAYKAKLLRPTRTFTACVIAGTAGLALYYLGAVLINGVFGANIAALNLAASTSMLGIGFTAFAVVMASLNLVLDFAFIEEAAERKMPRHMEWYGAWALLVTLVWLYIEVLRLLAKLKGRD